MPTSAQWTVQKSFQEQQLCPHTILWTDFSVGRKRLQGLYVQAMAPVGLTKEYFFFFLLVA
jgi:hypothetical protein